MKKLILGIAYNLAVLGAIVTGYVLTDSLWVGILLVFMKKDLMKVGTEG